MGMPPRLHIVYACFQAMTAEHIEYLALYRKALLSLPYDKHPN